jgi:hypothetical protein
MLREADLASDAAAWKLIMGRLIASGEGQAPGAVHLVAIDTRGCAQGRVLWVRGVAKGTQCSGGQRRYIHWMKLELCEGRVEIRK